MSDYQPVVLPPVLSKVHVTRYEQLFGEGIILNSLNIKVILRCKTWRKEVVQERVMTMKKLNRYQAIYVILSYSFDTQPYI